MADYTGMKWEYWWEYWYDDLRLYGNGFPTCTIEIIDGYEGFYSIEEVV